MQARGVDTAEAASPAHAARTARNRAAFLDFVRLYYDEMKVREAVERYVHVDYMQHNPAVADGREAAIAHLDGLLARATVSMDVRRLLVDGDYAVARFERKPVLEAIVPPAERMSRERLRSVEDGYFSTLEQNDGQLFTRFHPACDRVENGVRTTNNPEFMLPIAGLPCEAQFRLGWYRYDDRLRARRFPLFDVERGLVLAYGFIDHRGRLADYELTDGRRVESLIRRPHTFYLAELFRIEGGAIRQIEANFITVPYHMPSPWPTR